MDPAVLKQSSRVTVSAERATGVPAAELRAARSSAGTPAVTRCRAPAYPADRCPRTTQLPPSRRAREPTPALAVPPVRRPGQFGGTDAAISVETSIRDQTQASLTAAEMRDMLWATIFISTSATIVVGCLELARR